ncbi:MAG: 3-dehydroquinate synthase [Gammaproteobacteria bacterium]
MSSTITVDLGQRAYPIHIGPGLIDDHALVASAIGSRQVVLVSNEVVGPLYRDRLAAALADREVHDFTLADGEQEKNLANFERLLAFMLERRIERSGSVVALGGGVVGDLAGFAAACYQRGISYVQVPTTLLAQVDSAVGGKTAVNHPLGKNMIGAFHQPSAVIADTRVLASLPEREFAAGVAEVIKYGLIRDPDFLAWIDEHLEQLMARDDGALGFAIARSVQNKAEVVAADERESGQRALLNLGHTFGHAIETGLGYGKWLHGEAVAAGTCMAARMSARLGWLDTAAVEHVAALFARAGLPTAAPAALSPETLLEHMRLDKKNLDGRIRLVLLKSLGEAIVTSDYPDAELSATLAARG